MILPCEPSPTRLLSAPAHPVRDDAVSVCLGVIAAIAVRQGFVTE